jgi:hypothetical protein
MMLADERKLRKAKSVILHPTSSRSQSSPRYFYMTALLQPIKLHLVLRAYYYSDQSAFSASHAAVLDLKLMNGPSITSPPHFLVRTIPFLLALSSSLVLLLHARKLSNTQLNLIVITCSESYQQVLSSRRKFFEHVHPLPPEIPVKQLIAQEQHE